jgi:hypothetical protein
MPAHHYPGGDKLRAVIISVRPNPGLCQANRRQLLLHFGITAQMWQVERKI